MAKINKSAKDIAFDKERANFRSEIRNLKYQIQYRDKQIEEMTKDLCDIQCNGMRCNICDTGCEWRMLAIALYNAGYRKVSDVVREIFEDVEKHLKNLGRTGYVGNMSGILAELRKKHLGEDINAPTKESEKE